MYPQRRFHVRYSTSYQRGNQKQLGSMYLTVYVMDDVSGAISFVSIGYLNVYDTAFRFVFFLRRNQVSKGIPILSYRVANIGREKGNPMVIVALGSHYDVNVSFVPRRPHWSTSAPYHLLRMGHCAWNRGTPISK